MSHKAPDEPCLISACQRVIPNPSKWVKIKAHNDGWYFLREGGVFCPDHRPDWAPKLPVREVR